MRIPVFCLMLFVSMSARAGSACDGLLGDYAPAAGKPATLRVEKVGGKIVLRGRDAGQWSVETAPTQEAELETDGPDKAPPGACVLEVPGGELIKMPIGSPYQVTSITGNSFTTKHSTTGVLLRTVQGFCQMYLEDYGSTVPDEGRRLLDHVVRGAERMGQIIEDLLRLAQLGRQELRRRPIPAG